MIKHILFWQFKDAVRRDQAQKQRVLALMADSVRNMQGKIDGLLQAEIGENTLGNEWDFVFYTVFSSQAALDAYQEHPLHVAHKQMAAPYLQARIAADYVCQENL